MSEALTLEVAGEQVRVSQAGVRVKDVPLEDAVRALDASGDARPVCGVIPRGVRVWWERRDTVAVALEVPPHARSVRWLADDSEAPFGPRAKYRDAYLGFPWVVILLVFRRGSLTGQQQLYYRTESLDRGEDLLLPNLYNVAKGYGQRCWLCLAQLDDLAEESWADKIDAVVGHTFQAAFNQSSERHEGNSYWGAMRDLDPRTATIDAWVEATRKSPHFALDVAWKPARVTLREELSSMLDQVVSARRIASATDLAGIVTGARSQSPRRRPAAP